MLGEIKIREVAGLAKAVETAPGVPVILQHSRLDPKPSSRPKWHSRSGPAILNQLLHRHRPGTSAMVAITADNFVSDAENRC